MYINGINSNIERKASKLLRSNVYNAALYRIPFFAGNNSESIVAGFWNKFASLPPLIVTGICHMQNVTKLEA